MKKLIIVLCVASTGGALAMSPAVTVPKYETSLMREGLLVLACKEGAREKVEAMLDGGKVDVNVQFRGFTPLYMACFYGYVDLVKLLLKKGAQCNGSTSDGCTPLHGASEQGYVDIVKLLLKRGANPKAETSVGATPLHLACQNGRLKIAELLLEKGAHTIATSDGVTPLYLASQHDHVNLVKLLLANKADTELPMDDDSTPLYMACQKGNLEVVKVLLENGAYTEAAFKNGATPLYIACVFGRARICRLLLENGAQIQSTDSHGRTPLIMAAESGRGECCKVLIAHTCIQPKRIPKSDYNSFIKRFSASLMTFKQCAPLLPNDLQYLILKGNSKLRRQLAQVFISLLSDGKAHLIPVYLEDVVVDELMQCTLEMVKPLAEDAVKYAATEEIVHIIDPALLESQFGEQMRKNILARLHTQRNADRARAEVEAALIKKSCVLCGKVPKDRPFKRCGRCKKVHYCSPDCQRKHWILHKKVCSVHT